MRCSRNLVEEPLQSVRPIDEIEVAYSHECTFVFAPLRAWDAICRISIRIIEFLVGSLESRETKLINYLTSPSFGAFSNFFIIR
jgi:hypothetical protein